MSCLLLGDSNTTIRGYCLGLGPTNPRTPIYTQANVAMLVSELDTSGSHTNIPHFQATFTVKAARATRRFTFRYESYHWVDHFSLLVYLWSNPFTFLQCVLLEDEWINNAGAFHA